MCTDVSVQVCKILSNKFKEYMFKGHIYHLRTLVMLAYVHRNAFSCKHGAKHGIQS